MAVLALNQNLNLFYHFEGQQKIAFDLLYQGTATMKSIPLHWLVDPEVIPVSSLPYVYHNPPLNGKK